MERKKFIHLLKDGEPATPVVEEASVFDENGKALAGRLAEIVADVASLLDSVAAHSSMLAGHERVLEEVVGAVAELQETVPLLADTVNAHTAILDKFIDEHCQMLTFTKSSDADWIKFKCFGTADPVLFYSYDRMMWRRMTKDQTITFGGSEHIYVYGENETLGSGFNNYVTIESGSSSHVRCEGDPHCLLDGLFKPDTPRQSVPAYCFCNLFKNNDNIVPDVSLPATTLGSSCYYGMFDGCTGLLEAPELPATTVEVGCYANMFRNCSSLEYVSIAATVGRQTSFSHMLQNVAPSGTLKTANGVAPEGLVVPPGWTVI